MSDVQLILYDDEHAERWFPFTLTRPAGELAFGAFTQRSRAERLFRSSCIGYQAAADLAGFSEPGAPTLLDPLHLDEARARLFLSSRAVPGWQARLPSERTALCIGNEVIGFFCPPATPSVTTQELRAARLASAAELPGNVLRNVWELVTGNRQQLEVDLKQLAAGRWSPLPAGVHALGDVHLTLGSNVTVEPGVVLDFQSGPIHLEDGVQVRAFTRLAGPAFVGAGTTLLGGSLTGVTIGPGCKVRGEVEATIMLGYSNKAHDGFLGHAYVGSWVNLGALTTNSDLKNNYGTVRIWTPQGETDTGDMKIGCLLGDHVKTAIGSMINTGTVVGPGSNLFGGMPPKYVPAFSWGAELGEYEFEKFIATAQVVMNRRSVPLTDGHREMLRRAWQRGRRLGKPVQP
jgi:UDP-N-acetylglucosamine diphosphorylase/glucosamine-1-phosphate N-acetyltransferase